MTISYQRRDGREYGTLCTVSRVNGKVVKTYGEQLGRVLDKSRLIFKSRARGVFMLDPHTLQFLPPPPGIELPARKSRLKVPSRPVTYSFGDVYLIDKFATSANLYDTFRSFLDHDDDLKAMVCYYITSNLSNQYAEDWIGTSFAKFLFPKAKLSSQQVSNLFDYLGDESRQQSFFIDYLGWFSNAYKDVDLGNILVDSSGLPNSIHFPLTAISNHNGEISTEVRLIYVVQENTGLPIFFRAIPGNIIDVNTIARTIKQLEKLGVDTNYAITDAGYLSEENVELFYKNSISFLIRMQANKKLYKQIVKDHLSTIEKDGTLVKQRSRVVRVKKIPCYLNQKVDSKGNIISQGYPAFAYLCVDEERAALEKLKSIKRVAKGDLDVENYDNENAQNGVFILVSKRDIPVENVIKLYYTRQQIEQVFDFGKNYAGLLPLSVQKESTFRGHLLVTFIATVLIQLLSQKFQSTGYPITPTLANLRTQSCTLFKDEYITAEPNKHTREAYAAVGVEFPVSVCTQ